MTNDFSPYTAGEITDWLSQGVDMPTAPTELFVTVFDDTNTELDSSLSNAREGISTSGGWTKTGTAFENTNQVSLGEATANLTNIQDVALYDAATAGNQLARYTISNGPFDLADGSTLVFDPAELSFDVLD